MHLTVRIFLTIFFAFSGVVTSAQIKSGSRISDILSSHNVPTTNYMTGEWRYTDNSYVFFDKPGKMPSKNVSDRNLALMTVTPDNCRLIFHDGKTCTLSVGDKAYTLKWELNPSTREFKASLLFFSVKGYLVRDGENLVLIYSKSDLTMMMKFMCPFSTHKYIRELSSAMDITEGLSLCIIFKKGR